MSFKAGVLLLGIGVLSVGPPIREGFSTGRMAPYHLTSDIRYVDTSVVQATPTLDVYERIDVRDPQPTLIWFHGGGWTEGTKADALPNLLPYMEFGWQVVNVGYRLASVASAPAAVEDGICALRWVIRHAERYRFDTTRLVLSGQSAGGHLALTTAMIPATERMDGPCPGGEELRVAAVVDWFGVTDVTDLLQGANRRNWAVLWVGGQPNAFEIARRLSPLSYVRPGLPPVIAIQGDGDMAVSYSHSVRLVRALKEAGVDTELVTISGGGHGEFSLADYRRTYGAIKMFLARHGLTATNSLR